MINNFSEEAQDRTKRAMSYTTRAYEVLTSPEREETLPLAVGYISSAFSYVTQARSILLIHPEADNNWIVSAFLEQFEDFADAVFAFIDGTRDFGYLSSEYHEIEKLKEKFEKN